MADFEEVPEHLLVSKSSETKKYTEPQIEIPDQGSEVPAELVVPQNVPQTQAEDDTIPRIAGAAVGAGAGKYIGGLLGSKYILQDVLGALKPQTAATPELAKMSGMQRYLNPLLEPLGVASTHHIPLDKFAQEMGLPKGGLVGPAEIQAAVKEAQGSPLQRIATETARGKMYKTIPAKPARDLSHLIEPIPTAEQAAKAAKAAPIAEDATKLAKMKAALEKAGRPITPTGFVGKTLNTAMPILSMAGAGAEAADAYNRFTHGDYGRGIVSSLGALGSAASMVPHPVTRAVGTGAALAAPAINAAIDYFMPPKYAGGGGIKPVLHKPKDASALFEGIKAMQTIRSKK